MLECWTSRIQSFIFILVNIYLYSMIKWCPVQDTHVWYIARIIESLRWPHIRKRPTWKVFVLLRWETLLFETFQSEVVLNTWDPKLIYYWLYLLQIHPFFLALSMGQPFINTWCHCCFIGIIINYQVSMHIFVLMNHVLHALPM